MNPKVIAFYLPQFHRVPENDEWWGEGFTDWVSTKNAKPLFPGHYQPRIPAHDNYYNLLDKSTMEWQAKLARKAGIHGFCMYHYWFGEGKQILEKPAENLLEWKDIDINYCFSWANESWITSWSKLTGNAWADSRGIRKGKNEKGILLLQKYGDEEEWKKHFMYLLPFFKDERYIKKDGKPVFVIYKPQDVPKLEKMIECWNELAKQQGFLGMYIIGTNCKKDQLDAMLLYEPGYTQIYDKKSQSLTEKLYEQIIRRLAQKNICLTVMRNYKRIWKRIVNREFEDKVYPGGYVGFDATPRKGRYSTVTYNVNPRNFYRYFAELYKKCQENKKEFIFLTAWNEWGEGAYLEPDEKYGVAYLNAIQKVIKDNSTSINVKGKVR